MVSRSQIKEIASQIWDLTTETVDLEHFCERKLKELHPTIGKLDIADGIDWIVSEVKNQINKKIKSFTEKGIQPNFKFDDYGLNILRRYGSEKGNNNWISFVRRFRSEIKILIKQLEPTSFEHFCKHILECNGITAFVTRRTRDGGVDFYGLLEMRNYTTTVFLSSVRLRIIGQAKHHSGNDRVGEPSIDEIRTKYFDFERGQGTAAELLPDWFTEIDQPVIYMVATNTDFTSGARRSAARDNIILRDGDQIAEDIIHSPRSKDWFYTDSQGNNTFNNQLFLESFNK